MSEPSNGDVAAKLGKLSVQRAGHAVDAARQYVAVGAELRGEAIAGVDGRDGGRTGDGGAQGMMLFDQRDRASPRRNGVDRLGQRHTDHRVDRVPGTPRPARRLKLGDESRNPAYRVSPGRARSEVRRDGGRAGSTSRLGGSSETPRTAVISRDGRNTGYPHFESGLLHTSSWFLIAQPHVFGGPWHARWLAAFR